MLSYIQKKKIVSGQMVNMCTVTSWLRDLSRRHREQGNCLVAVVSLMKIQMYQIKWTANCLSCHSVNKLIRQTSLTRTEHRVETLYNMMKFKGEDNLFDSIKAIFYHCILRCDVFYGPSETKNPQDNDTWDMNKQLLSAPHRKWSITLLCDYMLGTPFDQ